MESWKNKWLSLLEIIQIINKEDGKNIATEIYLQDIIE